MCWCGCTAYASVLKNNYQPMKMNDEQLDRLLRESVERRELLDGIQRQVMEQVSRQARRQRIRMWARVVAFSFVMPLLALVFGWAVYSVAQHGNQVVVASLTLSVVAMLVAWLMYVRNFSLRRV